MLAGSNDEKRAVKYLIDSGAAAISITINAGGTTLVASKYVPGAALILWTRETSTVALARAARRYAGSTPDLETMEAAILRAAADHRETLTPHEAAISKAVAVMAKRLGAKDT